MHKSISYFLFIFCFKAFDVGAQLSSDDSAGLVSKEIEYFKHQTDLVDLAMNIIRKDPNSRLRNYGAVNTKVKLSAGPITEYLAATGFAGGVAVNGAFLTSTHSSTNLSSILLAIKYTQRHQFLLPVQSSVWLPGNKWYLLGDWRYLNYPQDTYGFGGNTLMKNVFTADYKYIRIYEFAFKEIMKDGYLGGGYRLDDHWDITQKNIPNGLTTDFTKYGFSRSSVSSGVTLNFLYDTRKNSINPIAGGFYANLEYQQNFTFLGSNSNWNSVLIDIRKYFELTSKTILALWGYSTLTLHGNPPYLDLPSIGGDTYNNTGRGYEQGRFLGKYMIDVEAEIRFPISRDGLIGGVIFTNANSFSELNDKLKTISFAAGLGFRIKLNKFSNANACIDYGIGKGGSHSFFGNLGEVF